MGRAGGLVCVALELVRASFCSGFLTKCSSLVERGLVNLKKTQRVLFLVFLLPFSPRSACGNRRWGGRGNAQADQKGFMGN